MPRSGPISCCTAASRCCCLLPICRTCSLRKEVLGEDARQGIQTNLVVLPNDMFAWLQQEDVFLGVSWDGGVGARLDRAGRPTEDRVFANMRRAGERGVRFGVTLVLGVHNRSLLPAVYDRLEDLGAAWLNVVPLFLSSTPATATPFVLSPDETFDALVGLFEHWQKRGRRLPVQPFVRSVWTVHHRQAGEQRPSRDGARFTVHPNGDLSVRAGTTSKDVMVGNLFDQDIHQILESDRYAREVAHADRLRAKHCTTCRYGRACDSGPILMHPHDYPSGPCPLESRLCDYIESELDRSRLDAVELFGWTSAELPAALAGAAG